jgi:hypothetical protein
MPPESVIILSQSAAEIHGRPHCLECIGGQFLWHQADLRPDDAVVARDLVIIYDHDSIACRDDAADDADQCRLARAVGTQQCKDFTFVDLKIDPLQRLKA